VLVLGHGAKLAALSIVLGAAGAPLRRPAFRSALYEIKARQSATFCGVIELSELRKEQS